MFLQKKEYCLRFFILVLLTALLILNISACGRLWGGVTYFRLGSVSDQSFEWLMQLGETAKNTQGLAVTISGSSYIYVTGQTTGNLVSCGGVSASCAGNSQGISDYFISKYDSLGNWIWTKQLGETAKVTFATSIAVDASSNVYVAGQTLGNLVSCGGVSAACAGNSQGTSDYFISKYDANGNWIWTIQLGETATNSQANAISIDSSSNVYVLGYTQGNLVSCGGVSAACAGAAQGTRDYFISKYDSLGSWTWTKQLGETAKTTRGWGMALDAVANIYVTGQTDGDLVSCAGVSAACAGNAQGTNDYFISKYDSLGNWIWTKQLGETGKSSQGNSIALDSSANVYVLGYTDGDLVSCAGVSAACAGNAQGTNDYFISKYDSSGNWTWTKQLGEVGVTSLGNSIALDSSSNIYVTGITNGNLTSCGGVSANCSGTAQGTNDYYISKYGSSGNWIWTIQLGETAKSSRGQGIVLDSNYNIYMTGYTTGNLVSCSGVSASCTGNAQGTNDYFLVKY